MASHKKSVWLLILVGLASLFLCSCQEKKNAKAVPGEPLLAVLCTANQGPKWKGILTPSSVYLIDPQKDSIINKIETRSPAYSLTTLNGKIYTANSGGIGSDCDTAIGVIDPYQGLLERYIELENPPGNIISSDTDLFITSGLYFPEKDEITWNKVNPNNSEIITFQVPGVTSVPIYINNKIYVSSFANTNNIIPDEIASLSRLNPKLIPEKKETNNILLAISPSTLDTKIIAKDGAYFNGNIVIDEKGNCFGLISRWREILNDIIIVFKPDMPQIDEIIPLSPQSEPAYKMIYYSGRLFVSYYNSDSMKGDSVVIYDTENVKPVNILKGLEGPVDMVIDGEKLFILCNGNSNAKDGEIVIVDLLEMKIVNKITIGKNPLKLIYVNSR